MPRQRSKVPPTPRAKAPHPRATQGAPQVAITTDRARQAMDLRVTGMSYPKIGDALGISSQAAWELVNRAIEANRAQCAEQAPAVRAIEVSRLDEQLEALWPKRDDPAASAAMLKISERRAKLMGLDAPSQVSVVTGSDDELVAEMATLLAAAGKLAGGDGGPDR